MSAVIEPGSLLDLLARFPFPRSRAPRFASPNSHAPRRLWYNNPRMSPRGAPSGVFKIARSGDAVYVKVVGLGTMNNSMTFKEFADRMVVEGYRRFIMDLAECRGVDSTFMGILLGILGDERSVVVINSNAHCRKQMESIGLHRVVRFLGGAGDPGTPVPAIPPDVQLHELPESETSPVARLKLILKAHKDLIALDKKNEEKFGAFLKDLAKNLGES